MPKVFRQIARLIYYSNGGFTFTELYKGMPVYVRRYMTKEINNIKQSEKEAMEEGKSSSSSGQTPPEDIGKAMKEIKKQADTENLSQRQSQKQPKEGQKQKPQNQKQKQSSEEPPKAKDLNQLIDKLK